MLKKSFLIVFIQIFGSLLGLINIYLIAGSMEPAVYSLVGVYTVVSGILATFSDLGLETTMMREALYWIECGDNDKVKEYSTQAIISRLFAFLIILPFLLVYLLYMNSVKYEGSRTLLLLMMLLGIQVTSINNAMSLIVRSRGDYVFAQAASTINNYVLKFSGIGIYYAFGADMYLYFYVLSSIPLSIVYIIKLRNNFSFKYVCFKPMLKKVIDARYLWLKTDLDYFKNNADSLLVSAIFPPSIMGSYTIFKNLEQLSKNVIEGFFDVLSQNTVKYKGQRDKLIEQEKKIKKARNVFILLILFGTGVFMIAPQKIIALAHLNKYEGMLLMILCVAIVSIIHLIGKYEINALAFFASSKLNFNMGIMVFVGSTVSFVTVYFVPTVVGMVLQRIIVYSITSGLAIGFFINQRNSIYAEIKN